jgi:hypothetical protein
MKKFLVLAIALVSSVAMADNHNRSMVTLSGYETGDRQDRSLDFTNSTGGNGTNQASTTNIALNYAYAVTNTWQVGASYKNYKSESQGVVKNAGDESKTIGLQVIYNLHHQLVDTCYAALHYDMKSIEDTKGAKDGSDVNTWGLEFGHRFGMGKLGGMNFTYSPSATLSVANTDFNGTADDSSTTSVTLNFVKFDVLF